MDWLTNVLLLGRMKNDNKMFLLYLILVEKNQLDCSQQPFEPRWVSCKSCTQFLQKHIILVNIVYGEKRNIKVY